MRHSLRGQYLVAARHMKDVNFLHTVVLIVEHSDSGAMGLILNRPTAVEVRSALEGHFALPEAEDPVFCGGPVEPAALFLLHDDAARAGGEMPVMPGLFVGANAEVFEQVVTTAPAAGTRYRVFSGCAGWGRDQLEGEIARGDWHLLPADTDTVFHGDPYAQWEALIDTAAGRHPLFPDATGDHHWN